jgi:hypothetical protein
VAKWSDQSGDYNLDSYATYAVGNIIDTTPKGLLSNAGRYARKLVEIDHIEAKTMVIDSHVGGLQGSMQFAAYTAAQPADQISSRRRELLRDSGLYQQHGWLSAVLG